MDQNLTRCRRRNRKRRRRETQQDPDRGAASRQHTNCANTSSSTHVSSSIQPLQGISVAVSTLDVRGQPHDNAESSYAAVAELCRSAGAIVTGQVHQRVHCLICHLSAVQHRTQRVRKAVKKGIPLVRVEWIRQCIKEQRLVGDGPYRLEAEAHSVVEMDNVATENYGASKGDGDENTPDEAWSEPVELGCCCVCHENGDDKCPWCEECNLNRARKRQKIFS